MNKLHRLKHTRLFLFATGLLLSIVPTLANAKDNPPVLITYSYEHELLPKSDGKPLLTIFINGNMRAIFPPYMKLAGIRQAQLNPDTLQELNSLISTNSLHSLSTETIAEELALYQAQQEQNRDSHQTVYAVMDSTTTFIEYNDPANNNEMISGENSPAIKIVQNNLSTNAKQYPRITTLQRANNLKIILQKILDTSNWTPVEDNS
ncbi:MAG: hypothetical protein L3J59_04430 [Methylococcaceae bacterium]|nr:hypothetical protein [Methylococcaceae bacterium]